MPKLTPCIWFDTEGEEAAALYTSIFPNSRITKVVPYPEGGMREAGTVMTVEFELDGKPFTALNGGTQFTPDEAISFQIECADQAEIDHYWSALAADGGEEGPCGWVKDRFGVSWQTVPRRLFELVDGGDPARAQRVMTALLDMRKIEIAELERAAEAE